MYIQNKHLFEERLDTSNPAWIVKRYFDEVYDSGHFVHVVSLLAKRWGYITDDVACHFPDHDSFFEEDRFEGVQFIVALPLPQPDEVVASDAEFVAWLQESCRRYLLKHPSDEAEISEALGQLATWFKPEH